MRDGILQFTDGTSATYERIDDDRKSKKNKLKITILKGIEISSDIV